jgi:hypothetical protein
MQSVAVGDSTHRQTSGQPGRTAAACPIFDRHSCGSHYNVLNKWAMYGAASLPEQIGSHQ